MKIERARLPLDFTGLSRQGQDGSRGLDSWDPADEAEISDGIVDNTSPE